MFFKYIWYVKIIILELNVIKFFKSILIMIEIIVELRVIKRVILNFFNKCLRLFNFNKIFILSYFFFKRMF